MSKLTIWVILLGVLAYVCICLFLYLQQRSLIYYPHPQVSSRYGDAFWLENGGHKLKIWRIRNEGHRALIYFGGNAEDVSHNLPEFQQLFPDYSLYLMNYRGYGGSSGSPSEAALVSDSLVLYDHVAAEHTDIVVMGRSLGTAVALNLAAVRPVAGAILVTPYSSMTALAKHYYPLLPVNPLLQDRFEAIKHAPAIEVPVLALLAEHDEVIPAKISNDLVNSFRPGIVDKVLIKNTYHNTIDSVRVYYQAIRDFVDNLVVTEGEK